MGRNKRRISVFVVLYCALFIISLGVVAFGLVMLKIAYDLHHPMEFLAVFFAASLVILIGGALALGFGLKVVQRLKKKVKKLKIPLEIMVQTRYKGVKNILFNHFEGRVDYDKEDFAQKGRCSVFFSASYCGPWGRLCYPGAAQ